MMKALRFLRTLGVSFAVLSMLMVFSRTANGQKTEKHVPLSIVSDWSHSHLIFPESKDFAVTARVQRESRWEHNWYKRHPEAWWPEYHPRSRRDVKGSTRDWSTTLGSATYEPLYDFNFSINTQAGFGSLNTSDQGNGSFLATAGSLTVTGANDVGTYSLLPGGPGITTSPNTQFIFDNLIYPTYPTVNPPIDVDGFLFANSSGFEINLWANSATQYEFDDTNYTNDQKGAPFNLNEDPGAGQTFPAKFIFDVTATPSCSADFLAMGIPSTPVSGGQANLMGVNNLYTEPGGTGFCAGTGPTVKYAYASGTGEVPGDMTISQFGTQIAYVENLLTGSSYFHVLTLGTTGNNGTSPTAAAAPGVGNNALDVKVLLSPDNGVTNQSSTNSPFIVYSNGDTNDVAYATTYSTAGSGSGYLYKIIDVFSGATTPRIAWVVPITAVPSSPVYDPTSNKVFFTDNAGRIDSVTDSGSPTVTYGTVVAAGTTSANAPVVDTTNQEVYATFNTNGTNAIVVQTPTSMVSTVTVPVGSGNTEFGGPYAPDFNNAFYTGIGTPLMYVAGTGSSATPTATLYGVGFSGSALNPSSVQTTALATGLSDSSPVTEFFNAALNKDYLFAGVTNHCAATTGGGTAGCIESLDITSGFPTVSASTTALAAAGGTTGIIVDNDSGVNQASSVYYATKTGSTLVKATQTGLN
jgi:hypothetical protein